MPTILTIAIILVALLMATGLVIVERRNATRTTCRCCKAPIRPGGVGCAQLGSGFCGPCLTNILRSAR